MFCMAAAFGALWLMQVVTPDAGVCSSIVVLKLGHRLGSKLINLRCHCGSRLSEALPTGRLTSKMRVASDTCPFNESET